jgi:hypothetical protein
MEPVPLSITVRITADGLSNAATTETSSQKTRLCYNTPVYDLLLHDLNTLQRATAEQLTRLNYRMGMIKTVKQRLKDLTAAGYVLPPSIPQ